MQISELMYTDPITVFGGDTIQHTADLMAKSNHGIAVVLNNIEDKKVIGVISNKDIINKVIAKKQSPETVFVSQVMIKNVLSLSPNETTSKAMYLMSKNNVKRIVVVEKDVLQGVISATEIVKGMLKYKKELLDLAIDF
jgi:CBS domain-containing protein